MVASGRTGVSSGGKDLGGANPESGPGEIAVVNGATASRGVTTWRTPVVNVGGTIESGEASPSLTTAGLLVSEISEGLGRLSAAGLEICGSRRTEEAGTSGA